MSLLKNLQFSHSLHECFMEIHHSLIGSYQVIYRSCFQDFANDKMDWWGWICAILIHPFLICFFVICFSFAGDKYLTFPFSYLSLRVSLTLRKRKTILCCQALKSQRCTGYVRPSVKAISSPISHLVANSPRGIPNGFPPH